MTNSAEKSWKKLYWVGALAPIFSLVFYVSEFVLIDWNQFPTSTETWFELFQRSKLLGLFYLNSLDIISITFLGVMFVALFIALLKIDQAWMVVAAFFSLLGVVVFVVPRVAMLSMMTLSDQYAVAVTEAERARLLAAGETLSSLGTATPQTMGFFFMAIGVMILSVVMLRDPRFYKVTAWFGILASAFTFLDDISIVLVPTLATLLMILSGFFWLPWWLLVSLSLFRLARQGGSQSNLS